MNIYQSIASLSSLWCDFCFKYIHVLYVPQSLIGGLTSDNNNVYGTRLILIAGLGWYIITRIYIQSCPSTNMNGHIT
jgi:hypothetical protein